MARITVKDYDWTRHRNHLHYIDDVQRERHQRAPTITPCKVCVVNVCGFEFVFFSVAQVERYLAYYSREHHPSSRLPVETGHYGGDHWECQRWYEKLPKRLLQRPKREKVVTALQRAGEEYSKFPEAHVGPIDRDLHDW